MIVDEAGARGKLARKGPDGRRIPLQIGDNLELNDQPLRRGWHLPRYADLSKYSGHLHDVFARDSRLRRTQRKMLSFVLVKAKPGVDLVHCLRSN